MATKFRSKINNAFDGVNIPKGTVLDAIPKGMDPADFEPCEVADEAEQDQPETIKHVVTQEDYDANQAAYDEQEVKVGDEIDIPNPEYKAPEKKAKKGRK